MGVLTVSDGVAAGTREDVSGGLVAAWAEERGYEIAVRDVVADETLALTSTLVRWADEVECDVVLTTGGTGLAERDVTPEATRSVLEREAPGLAEAIRTLGRDNTPYAILSRGVAGLRGSTLIVNLPGSPAGVRDGLSVLGQVLDHAVELVRGSPTDHG